jgi:hypothetical protein
LGKIAPFFRLLRKRFLPTLTQEVAREELNEAFLPFISYARKPQALSLGMNGILSKRSQVKPGEAEQIPT